MNQDFMIAQFLQLFWRNFPAIFVLVICAMMTLSQWQRHPPSARWAFTAFLWLLLTDLTAIAWYAFGFQLLVADHPQWRDEEAFYTTLLSCCEAAGYVFFLFAINAARTPYRPREYYDDHADDEDRPPT